MAVLRESDEQAEDGDGDRGHADNAASCEPMAYPDGGPDRSPKPDHPTGLIPEQHLPQSMSEATNLCTRSKQEPLGLARFGDHPPVVGQARV